MPKPDPSSRGLALAERLRHGLALAARAPRPGARDLPVLEGVTPRCTFTEPLENVAARAAEIVAATGRVFVHGNAIALEVGGGPGRCLVPLAQGGRVETYAAAILANLFVCQAGGGDDEPPVQFPPPPALAGLLLNSEAFRAALPNVRLYTPRPVFDADFVLLGPGWHPGPRVLVHGPAVEPVLPDEPDPAAPAIDRLPPRLRQLLGGFCFREDADLANAVAFLVTTLLVDRFVTAGKPIALVDGNQPGLGKTLLARTLGVLLDGLDPALIHYTGDEEELAKRICATLRGGQSLVLVDNAKVPGGARVDSRVLEANAMAPRVALRILGQSANFERPNDVLWALTMNDTRVSPDLVSRGVPIRLSYEGRPEGRKFAGPDPIDHATEHRAELLGELAGLVVRWNQRGRPPGGAEHRCGPWARTVGGILAAAGLPEFLANYDEAAASFDTGRDELAALAEAAYETGGPAVAIITEGIEQ